MSSQPTAFETQPGCLLTETEVSFAEIISALSFAIDLTEGAVPGHAVRSCILGMRIAEEIKLSEEQQAALYYALLLKDSGCSNNAARMCQIVGGDDIHVKNGAKLQDWTKPWKPSLETVRMLWREVLPGASWLARVKRILSIGIAQHSNNAEMITLRCERGAEIARKLGLSTMTAEAVHGLDEHWDGSGYPDRLRGDAIPILARIIAVAQHLDIFACERSPEEAIRVLRERSTTWFDPRLVKVVLELEKRGRLWTHCKSTDDADQAHELVLGLQPDFGSGVHSIQDAAVDRICEAFADVVDAKSPFTYRHSVGVAEIANEIAGALELPPDRLQLVRRAALLHDLGKLGVSNTILDKTSALTPEEWKVVVEHPRLTREILARVRPFQEIAIIAGAHHERLDGTGYPDKLQGAQLCLEARLIAVADFYRALTEDRPYRVGMPHEDAMAILRKQGAALDGTCLDALDMAKRLSRRTESPRLSSPVDEQWYGEHPGVFSQISSSDKVELGSLRQ
jgi:putative nucleotidyltransferase with HDIG domain